MCISRRGGALLSHGGRAQGWAFSSWKVQIRLVRGAYHVIGGEPTHELPQVGLLISWGPFGVKNSLPVFGDVYDDPLVAVESDRDRIDLRGTVVGEVPFAV